MNYLLVVLFMGLVAFASYRAGYTMGKPVGYAICVSEEDDDHIRTRKF